jgi:helix-turn-helix protein
MSGSFGARLRQHRESQHIPLADIAAATKIQATLFEGLERDDVSRWPAGIFRRAFVRAYADAIGLEPDAVCREFVDLYPEPGLPITLARGTGPLVTYVPPNGVCAADTTGRPAFDTAAALRLTLADTPLTRAAAAIPPSAMRALAVACDATVPLTIALAVFVVFDRFWMPLALASLGYCLGSLWFVGTTLGLWLLTPRLQTRPEKVPMELSPEHEIVYQPVDMDTTHVGA